jgi:hypothetical protein
VGADPLSAALLLNAAVRLETVALQSRLSTGFTSTSVAYITSCLILVLLCVSNLSCAAEPFEHWFYIHEWAPLIIFFGTYLGIVRNKKIPHVARYHIMMVSRFTPQLAQRLWKAGFSLVWCMAAAHSRLAPTRGIPPHHYGERWPHLLASIVRC